MCLSESQALMDSSVLLGNDSEYFGNILGYKAEGFPHWKIETAFLFSHAVLGLQMVSEMPDFSSVLFPTLGCL